jgi:hypothetical protein
MDVSSTMTARYPEESGTTGKAPATDDFDLVEGHRRVG